MFFNNIRMTGVGVQYNHEPDAGHHSLIVVGVMPFSSIRLFWFP